MRTWNYAEMLPWRKKRPDASAKSADEAGHYYNDAMHYLYVLESEEASHWYVGITNNIQRRLAEHNSGKTGHTKKFLPWKLRLCLSFRNRSKAEEAELYFKSHSGRAFMKKHFSE